jgi:methanogenic corrinoid protein MtbC1
MGSLNQYDSMPERTGYGGSVQDNWQESGSYVSGTKAFSRSGADSGQESAEVRLSLLARAIEYEIIPRLMLAHRAQNDCMALPALVSKRVSTEDVEEFAKLVLYQDEMVARACIDAMRTRGISVETIYLDLLAPVARHLGDLWERDLCDFSEVTVGLGRLQQVLHETSASFSQPANDVANGQRVLLVPCPGEQHTFGLAMVAEFFHRAGWEVAGGPSEAGADPVALVKHEWFDVVGFSLACESGLPALSACIRGVRAAARNANVGIIVGGPVFVEKPEYGGLVQADAVALSGRDAPALADKLVAGRHSRAIGIQSAT